MSPIELLVSSVAKKINRTGLVLLVLFVAITSSWSHSGRHYSLQKFSQKHEFKKVHDGVEFSQFIYKIGDEPVAVSALRLDLNKVRLDVVHAFDKAVGVEKTSEMAKSKNSLAAINAGFFRLDTSAFAGEAAGILQIDGKLLSESSNDRVALMLKNNGGKTSVEFAHLKTSTSIMYELDEALEVDGLNRERKTGDVIVYTPEFGASTLTDKNGTEVVFKTKKCKNELCILLPHKIRVGDGNAEIPSDGVVVSIGNSAKDRASEFLAKFDRVKNHKARGFFGFYRTVADKQGPKIKEAEDIVNGVPQLIKNGKIDITWQQEKAGKAFAENRHPRTAVAKLKDGKFLMVAVDGRQPGYSVGMTLQELAEMLLEMGATDAMNLDGGGSTTIVLDGKVVNKPSDKEGERRVSDALVVSPRKK